MKEELLKRLEEQLYGLRLIESDSLRKALSESAITVMKSFRHVEWDTAMVENIIRSQASIINSEYEIRYQRNRSRYFQKRTSIIEDKRDQRYFSAISGLRWISSPTNSQVARRELEKDIEV